MSFNPDDQPERVTVGVIKSDRRSFLKIFGVSTAVVAAIPAPGEAMVVETVTEPLAVDPFPARTLSTLPSWDRNWFDVVDQPLYSRLRIERNAMKDDYRLFGDALGGGCDWSDTNINTSNRLDCPNKYCIRRIGFVFSPQVFPEYRSAFIDRYRMTLTLGRKIYWEAPLSMAFSVGEPDREKGFATLPDKGMIALEIPLIIDNGLYFSLEVSGKPIHPCGKLTGWGVFEGLMARGIQ